MILYVGLFMVFTGLLITFLGLGNSGFRTLELRLLGPSLVGCGVFISLLRILFCTLPSCCGVRKKKTEEPKLERDQRKLKTTVTFGDMQADQRKVDVKQKRMVVSSISSTSMEKNSLPFPERNSGWKGAEEDFDKDFADSFDSNVKREVEEIIINTNEFST